jgi:hypothetical protein
MEVTYTEEGNSFVAGRTAALVGNDPAVRGVQCQPDTTRAIIAAPAEPRDGRHTLHVTFLLNLFDELRRRAPAAIQ